MNADSKSDNENTDDDDETSEDETETTSSSSSSGSKGIPVSDYTAEEAIAEKAENGTVILPDELSDDVRDILKSAADTLTAGLFNAPTIDQYSQDGAGDSKGFKAKKISPAQQPGKKG